jgi:predicted Zn-dependent protease
LREFEANPNICAEDPEMQAAWLASHAVTWAFLRDFSTAHKCLDRARSLRDKDGWVTSCESDVLGLEERWSEALNSAELAWEIDSGTPHAARSLAKSLLNTGRVHEAAERLTVASENCQSFEVVHLACWYQCALAETLEDDRRRLILRLAERLAARLPTLMPLADRDSRRVVARTYLDIAEMSDNHAEMERWAEEARIPFYRKILSNLRQNSKGPRKRLPFARTIQKHQACLPTSLASALATVGQHLDPDVMASEITFGGTSEWAAAEWLQQRGFTVRFFAATPETASALIKGGIGFVLTFEGDDNAHAVAAVGLDEATGTLIIHDPMGYRSVEYLLEGLAQQRQPLGIRAIAVVPPEKAALLDGLLPAAQVELMTAAQDYQKALTLFGPSAAREIVGKIEQKYPTDPGTRFLRSIQIAEDGHTGEALLSFQRLLNEFPNSPNLRSRLLGACRMRGNTALMRETLAGVVQDGILPGVQSQQDWRFPPARYVAEYADLLSVSAEARPEARAMLNGLIGRQPQSAEGWHVLGDLHRKERNFESSLLCFRLASCRASDNEHYAFSYCDALARNDRLDEGLSWLEQRVRKFINTQRAVGTWVTWIRALEAWGQPDRALSVCSDALAHQGAMPELLGFVVPFLARMGRWQEAKEQLGILEKTGNIPLFREAAAEFYRLSGDLRSSIENAEDWVRECPHQIRARHVLVDLITRRDGNDRALELASRWTVENAGHDELEGLRYRQLEVAGEAKWKKYSVLLRRVRRNPEDGWAWRELTFRCIEDFQQADVRRQAKYQKRLPPLLRECDRTAPEEAATIRVHARWCEVSGRRAEAASGWLSSIERDPENSYGYGRLWECTADFEPWQQRDLWNKIEPIVLRSLGHLSNARDIVSLLAQRFGVKVAEEVVTRWNQLRPDDPEIVESFADLLLEHGQGRTDAQRAYELLRPLVDHFPFHLGLRFSQVQACRKLSKFEEAEEVLREIVRRHPENANARIQLAWVHELKGQGASARNLLEEATASDPRNTQISDGLVQILIRHGQFDEAKRLVLTTLERAPRDVTWRDRAIKLLLECGDEEGAVTAARAGVNIYPRGAHLWFLLGITLNKLRRFAGPGEIELCFRRSVSLNPVFFDAADLLSVLLVEQRRYEDSENVMLNIRPRLSDSSQVQGRLAWIQRQQGKKQEGRNEMASVVRSHPWYLWGWAQLMDWLLEDKAWDQARELLARVPEEVRTDPRFRRQRLVVLQSADLPISELDAEWSELLSDFPQELSLHLHRYDLLQEAKRVAEAQGVLNAFHPIDPNDPYYLARLVEVRAQERKPDEAIGVMLDIFYAESESSAWPANYAWEALKKAQLINRAYDEACRLLEKQRRPTPEAFSILCSHALEQAGTQKRIPQTLWSSYFKDRGVKEVLRFLELADNSAWTDPVYRAIALNRLNSIGHYRLVKNYWKKNKEEVETDVRSWSETGRALASMKHRREARELLSSWRRRKGVSMWMIANYIGCLSAFSKSDLNEIVSCSGDALRDLPHDHCARYLAHVRAESYALLGDKQGLLNTWTQYRTYFDCKEASNDWFQDKRRPLLTDIPMLVRFLEQKQYGLYRRTVRRLQWRHMVGSFVKSTRSTQTTRIPWWAWMILFWILMQILRTMEAPN